MKIRAFLALDISDEVQKSLGNFIETIQSQVQGVKWVAPNNFHVTLKFFGNIDGTQHLKPICATVEKTVATMKPVTLECVGIGAFPKWEYARVIWAGLRGPMEGLVDLQQKLEMDFEELGFPKENREFKPHLTVGRRIKGPPKRCPIPSGGMFQDELKDKLFGRMLVDHLTLYKSQLTKQGPVYTGLRVFHFG